MKQSNLSYTSFETIKMGKCSHFCTNVYILHMWMFFKLVSEKHDFCFVNNYSLFEGWFCIKNVKYGLLEVFERGILTELCLFISLVLSVLLQSFKLWVLLQQMSVRA